MNKKKIEKNKIVNQEPRIDSNRYNHKEIKELKFKSIIL